MSARLKTFHGTCDFDHWTLSRMPGCSLRDHASSAALQPTSFSATRIFVSENGTRGIRYVAWLAELSSCLRKSNVYEKRMLSHDASSGPAKPWRDKFRIPACSIELNERSRLNAGVVLVNDVSPRRPQI